MMRRIEELIRELCPDGVEYRKLSEVCDVLRGKRLTKSQLSETRDGIFAFPVLHGGMEPMGYYNESNRKAETTIVINTGNAGNVYYSNEPYWSSDACFSLYPKNNDILDRFLYFFMATKEDVLHGKIRSGAMPTIDAMAVESLMVPIPPLEIQKEIVKVLDNFTDYSTELQVELQARIKQYEYYRDKLLDRNTGVEVKLDEIIESLNTGLNPRRFFKLNTEDAKNAYITIREIRNGKITPTQKTDRINDEALKLCNKRSNLEAGDILFSGTGTVGETAVILEKPTNWNIKEGVYAIKPKKEKINSLYLKYLLDSRQTRNKYMSKTVGGTVRSLPMAELRRLRITLPSMEVQTYTVSLLEKFNNICNSFKSGLPAEIAARQKQYEYYRNQLLTFKELQK